MTFTPPPAASRPDYPSDAEALVERLLREQAPRAAVVAPARLHARITERLRTTPQRRSRRLPFALLLTGSLAAAAAITLLTLPWPAAPARTNNPLSLFDASPVVGPAARLVSGSIDKPLLQQATYLVRDTKRATRALIELVPFASRGG